MLYTEAMTPPAILLFSLVTACTRTEVPPAAPPSSPAITLPDGGPDRLACTADQDCVVTYVEDERLCCPPPAGGVIYARAFTAWRDARIAERCGEIACEADLLPPPPEACRLSPRCLEGRCADSCADPSPTP
jgi:hypothetical protein